MRTTNPAKMPIAIRIWRRTLRFIGASILLFPRGLDEQIDISARKIKILQSTFFCKLRGRRLPGSAE
jgi:hypothetical protein